MARRSKVDIHGLVERILGLYNEGKTIIEIEAILKGEGYDISRESIRRKLKSSREVAELYRKSLDEAKVLLEAVRDNPNTDVIEVTNSLLAHKLFEFAKSVEELNFENPNEFVLAVRQLSDAQVKVAKLRLDFQKGFEAAKKEIMQSLSLELSKQPDLKQRLVDIIERLKVEQ
ncbi:MAG: DUF3486 family protein [Nitrospinae bacterium]|nr:DUF3486 family protein [Nitrospinota bacterium]